MKNVNKVVAGRKNKRTGEMFENIFLSKARSQGIAIDRFPDGCKSIGRTIIRVKTPFDFICSYQGKAAFFDTKCFEDDRITASKIAEHQMASLMMHERQKIIAGYVVYFRKKNEVKFFPASSLALIFRGIKEVPSIMLGDIMRFDIRKLFTPTDGEFIQELTGLGSNIILG